jgi:fucose permease
MSLIIRGLLALGSLVTGWLVAEDSPNFGVMQGMLTIAVFAVLVFAVALWPKRWR